MLILFNNDILLLFVNILLQWLQFFVGLILLEIFKQKSMDVGLECVDLAALLTCNSIDTVVSYSWKKRWWGLIILILESFGTQPNYACSGA